MRLTKRTNLSVTILLFLIGLTCFLVLPVLPVGKASTATRVTGRIQSGSGLDSSRQAAMEKLYAQYKAGNPFSEEEAVILNKFGTGATITNLEADVVTSRALYDFYISGGDLTKEQQLILDTYTQAVMYRPTGIADLKTRLLNKRIAAAAAAPPRNTPLVAPANDLCSGAEVIPASGPFPYLTAVTNDITDATVTGDPPLPTCQTSVSRSIWYTITPAATATYTISSCPEAPTQTTVVDTVMAIYTSTGGCAGPFTQVPSSGNFTGCDDDSCANIQATITTQLNAGTQYYILVWLFGTAPPNVGETAVQLQVLRVLPAANDTCATATALSLNTPLTGSSAAAFDDYELSGAACFTGIGQTASTAQGRDVVYSFTAPSAGNYSFRVTDYDSSDNLVLYVASTCPAATPGTPVTVGTCLAASNRQAISGAEEVSCMALTASQQVFIFVDDAFPTAGSAFTIEATRCDSETEPNGTPATANMFVQGIEGGLGTAGDVDFFSLGTPAAGSRVFAMLDGVAGSSTDFDLRLTTTTDTLQYDDASNDFPFGGLSPNIAGARLTGVASYLRVNQLFNTPDEPYRLYSVTQPPGANALPNCAAQLTSATPETEPNNTIATANSAANKYFSGTLAGPSPSTDVDVFSFTANMGDLIFLSLDGDPCRDNTPINGQLELLDSAGVVLVSVNDGAQKSDTTSGAGSLIAETPFSPAEALVYRARTTATYYARVSISPAATMSPGAGDYLLSIFTGGATATKFANDGFAPAASALRFDDGVSVRWHTGFEVNNLGFNIYRVDSGRRTRVNSQLIAGSALMVGGGTSLGAGKSYAWYDNSVVPRDAQYMIEAVDLSGDSTWYGPVRVSGSGSKGKAGTVEIASSPTMAQLGRSNPIQSQTTSVDRQASIQTLGAGASLQAALGQQSVKLGVKAEGFYRVTQPELVAAGFNPSVDPRNLRLVVDGKEQPMIVTGKGVFDSSSAIEFYGIGVDSASTDEHVYWLTAGSQPGERIQLIGANAKRNAGGSFLYTAELKERSLYFSGLRNGDKENFFGAVIARDPVDQVLTLQHVDAGSPGGATLEVALQGVTMAKHKVEVEINGSPAGELKFDDQASGKATLSIEQSLLKEGANLVRLVSQGGPSDISVVDYIRVSYWHSFTADNDQLRFNVQGKQAVAVDGFGSSAVRVLDVTNPDSPRELSGSIRQGKSGYAVTLNVPGSGMRTLVAMTNDSLSRAARITRDQPSSWRKARNSADLVIFARSEYMMALEPLKALRQSQGYKVAVVDIEDVYDEFSYGNRTPQALKDFLAFAHNNWKVGPRFAILAGDTTVDPKNYLGFGANDEVPTKLIDTQVMETASDDWLADFDGDGVADIAIGRLPIRSPREAGIMVNKIVAYDRGSKADGVLLVSDESLDGVDFEVQSGHLRTVIPGSQRIEQISRGSLDPAIARSSLLDAINRGQKIVNYSGHGNAAAWRSGLLTTDDVSGLTNSDRLSLFVMMTCLNGYFADAQNDSLAESLVRAENGGAIAVWASTGMTPSGDQGVMNVDMFRRLFESSDNPPTLGEIAIQAKSKGLNKDARMTWVLFGDPTTRIR